jgi:hypothetical protein
MTMKRLSVCVLAHFAGGERACRAAVRAEPAFPRLVRFILGETGAPYDWSKIVP